MASHRMTAPIRVALCRVLGLVLLGHLSFGVIIAMACSIAIDYHETSLWHRLTDWTPPDALTEPTQIQIKRGQGPTLLDDGMHLQGSCDDLGWVHLFIDAPNDNGTLPTQLGYEFEIVRGTAPSQLIPERAIRAVPQTRGDSGYTLGLFWNDGATDQQEPLHVELVVRVVDRGANRSNPSPLIVIRDPG